MSSCAVTPASADDAELQRRWVETVKKIAAVQPSRGGLLQSSRAVSDDGETLVVAFPKGDDAELQRRWVETVKKIAAVQPSRGGLLQSSRAVSDDGETLVVAFPKGSNFALKMISRPDSNALVMPVICEVFGKRSVEYVMDGAPAGAPAAPAQPAGSRR